MLLCRNPFRPLIPILILHIFGCTAPDTPVRSLEDRCRETLSDLTGLNLSGDEIRRIMKEVEGLTPNETFSLGIDYEEWEDGNGRESYRDDRIAAALFRLAAERGSSGAMISLGHLFKEGRAVTASPETALRWYRRSAGNRNPLGQFHLAEMYRLGQGISVNQEEAVHWYRKAAERHYDRAQYQLAVMYQHGQGVSIDLAQARHWYERAAEHGHPLAKQALQSLP